MCGINGAFAYSPAATVDREEIVRVRDAMRRRGPDGDGAWFSPDGRIGFGHRRLSIIDLSDRAAQPMSSEDGRLVIVFNGEIYNHEEIRRELEHAGDVFTTTSDTEVILHLYRRRGAAMLSELRGMFAMAIWDARDRSLFLARDPYGIKPLYYADDGATFRFASRVRPLIDGGHVSKTIEPAGEVSFFLRGYVMQPFTTYEAIRALPAASHMTVTATGHGEPVSYFSIASILRDAVEQHKDLSVSERQAIIADAVEESVRYHLVSDVPVGAFLSGGKDSTALVGHATSVNSRPLHTITVAFDEYRDTRDDESPVAEMVAREYGTHHVTRRYSNDEFKNDLTSYLGAMDQPTVDAINTFIVSKAAAEQGLKVAISGTGGDELFGGYSTFTKIPRLVRRATPFSKIPLLPRAFRALYSTVVPSHRRFSARSAGILEYGGSYTGAYLLRRGLFMPWELKTIMDRDFAEEGLKRLNVFELIRAAIDPDPMTPFARIVALDSVHYMRDQLLSDIDWASMYHSLEIRVPLIDPFFLRKVALAAICDKGDGKNLLARSPRKPLPEAVLTRRKRGFAVPVRAWLMKDDPRGSRKWYGLRLWARRIWEWTSEGAFTEPAPIR